MDRKNLTMFLVGGLIVALGLAFIGSPLASSSPDGLERVSVDEGFDSTAQDHGLADSPLADYGVRGVEDEGLSTGLAGIIGVVVTFGLGLLLFAAIRTLRARREAAPPSPA
ncbi:MAG: PDGLE domain-containing protein [Actinomycetota bacterium]